MEEKQGEQNGSLSQIFSASFLSAVTVPTLVETDEMFIALWLHGRPAHTIRAYRFEAERFRRFIFPTGISELRLKTFQDYLGSHAASQSPNTRRRSQAALQSLFSFGMRVGYLPANLGLFLRPIASKDTLSERILDEATVHRVIAHEKSPRNRTLLRLLYAGGLRVSELCRLSWRDLADRNDAGQITIYGKGGKTRVVLLSAATWRELLALKAEASAGSSNAPLFPSQKGGAHLDPSQVLRIVKRAAARAGVNTAVSPHWFRHAHASHALERGCPISLVQSTLGHASVSTTGRYLHARPGDSSARYLGV